MKKKLKLKNLSDIPSVMLGQALHDLEIIEKDKRYKVDMMKWHSGDFYGSKCEVCLGGSVMARRDSLRITDTAKPDSFVKKDNNKLGAIDHFRTGHIMEALEMLGIEPPFESIVFKIPNYEYDKSGWKKGIKQIIGILKAVGL